MNAQRGFSLAELMVALTITAGISGLAFHLFQQNGNVFRDQSAIMEAQQASRVAISEVSDEIRMAGQSVPLFSATFDALPSEGAVAFLNGCTASRVNLRSGRSGIEATVTAAVSLSHGIPTNVIVSDASLFSGAIGNAPTGRFVYIWGPAGGAWGWARAGVSTISAATQIIVLTVVEIGGSATSIQFTAPPTIGLEEAVTIYRDAPSGSLRRATATNLTDPASPVWAPANEVAANVPAFTLTYYDRTGAVVTPDTLAHRAAISRVDIGVTVQVENPLSNRSRPSYALSTRTIPRNLRIP